MLKQSNFLHSQHSRLPNDAPAKFYFFTTFGLSFKIRSVVPTRLSTSHAYLIAKMGTRSLNKIGLISKFMLGKFLRQFQAKTTFSLILTLNTLCCEGHYEFTFMILSGSSSSSSIGIDLICAKLHSKNPLIRNDITRNHRLFFFVIRGLSI